MTRSASKLRSCLAGWLTGLALLLPLCRTAPAAAQERAVAVVRQGRLAGTRDRDLAVFKGVPFARPPLGRLRWRPPEPATGWTGTRDATAFAPGCVQGPHPILNPAPKPTSEDCLYLNVWSPAAAGRSRLPVLVWIHGGGFSWGATSTPLFDGAALARKGVVVVSLTYRLGPLGFLALPELGAESPRHVSGNYGLLDQIAALKWVRDNARAFGGDGRRVTIMGESAGGESVRLLVRSPLARGLFRGAIAESSADFGRAGGFDDTLSSAEGAGRRLMERLGARSLADLRAMPADRIVGAAPPGPQSYSLSSGWPVVDGYVVPTGADRAYRAGRFNDVPILIGNNANEWGLFAAAGTVGQFEDQLRARFGADADRLKALYPAGTDAEAARSSEALLGDLTFALNNVAWAERQAGHGRRAVYLYAFSHTPPPRAGVPPGPIHGAELPYVFDNLGARNLAWTPRDREIAANLSDYWTNFAKTGDPNGAGLPRWPRFTATRPEALLVGSEATAAGVVPHLDRILLLRRLLDNAATGSGAPARAEGRAGRDRGDATATVAEPAGAAR